MKKFFICTLLSITIFQSHTITFTDIQSYFYTYSWQAVQTMQNHKIATATIAFTVGLGLFFAYKPCITFLYKKPPTPNSHEEIIKQTVLTMRPTPYYISPTTYVVELLLEKYSEHNDDCDTIPFMALNIYSHDEFVEQKFITAKNITILEYYREEQGKYLAENTFTG